MGEVRQLRLVVEAEDYDAAVAFSRDALGLVRVAPRLRVALEVADTVAATRTAADAGATVVAPPTTTPWRSLNSRLDAPAGLHVTLFEELAPARH